MPSSATSHSATVGGTREANVAAEDKGAVAVLLLLLVLLPVAVTAAWDDDNVRSLFLVTSSLVSLVLLVVM